MNALWLMLYKFCRSRLRAQRGPRLVCVECGCAIHKNDRYRVLECQHVKCEDPKLVGQLALPESLAKMIGEA